MFIARRRYKRVDPSELEDPATFDEIRTLVVESAGVTAYGVTMQDGVVTTLTAYQSRSAAEAAARVAPKRLKQSDFSITEISTPRRRKSSLLLTLLRLFLGRH